ncbi:MAG TPA: hypothetical protein VHA56_02745 [Mucilaginibacter sp.]|nr:hypothetical protein [Mucilaginibacter sp.]
MQQTQVTAGRIADALCLVGIPIGIGQVVGQGATSCRALQLDNVARQIITDIALIVVVAKGGIGQAV